MKEQQTSLIGPARLILCKLLANIRKQDKKGGRPVRIILHGHPGTGKTTIANAIAREIAGHAVDVQSINGRNLTIDEVRAWQRDLCYGSLCGGWKVKIINEADLIPQVAQDLMLTYLDEIPPKTAVLATSNAAMDTLTERFSTRLAPVFVDPPSSVAIAELLEDRVGLSKSAAIAIAEMSCGNVRDALLTADSFSVVGYRAERPERGAEAKPVDPSRSESSKRAWETMRRKSE